MSYLSISMHHLLRLIFAIFLGCVFAVGNLPAWLHVASHSGGNSHTKSAATEDSFCLRCSCGHHAPGHGDQSEKPEHDHQNCPICNAIYTFFLPQPLQADLTSTALLPQPLCLTEQRSDLTTDLSVPDSRGPPPGHFYAGIFTLAFLRWHLQVSSSRVS